MRFPFVNHEDALLRFSISSNFTFNFDFSDVSSNVVPDVEETPKDSLPVTNIYSKEIIESKFEYRVDSIRYQGCHS